MTWREISVDKLNSLKHPLVVDVRSPCEHQSENIPNSVNVPLLTNDERAEVGTIYKQQGEVVARRHALKIVSQKIPALMDQIIDLRLQGQPLVVHCWRGGLRSEAVASFLSIIGIDCFRLTGGYKAWRRQVLADFEINNYEFIPIVLDGLTGVGKTKILHLLGQRGYSTLDLESLANHRGSIFGSMGLGCQPTQKNFDAKLWQMLNTFSKEPVFLEAESRKIGRIALPDFIVKMIAKAPKILISSSIAVRSKRIIADYAGSPGLLDIVGALKMLDKLKERLGAAKLQAIESQVQEGRLLEAVQMILTDYYDPLYFRQIISNQPYAFEISSDNEELAVQKITDWLTWHATSCQAGLIKPFNL